MSGSRADGKEADESGTGDLIQTTTEAEHAGDVTPHDSSSGADSDEEVERQIRRDSGPPDVQPGNQTIDGNVDSDDRVEDSDVPSRRQLFEVVAKHMSESAERFDQMQLQIMAMMAMMQQKVGSTSDVSPPYFPAPTMNRSVELEGDDASAEPSPGFVDVSRFDLTERMADDDLDTKARRQSILARVEDGSLLTQRIPEIYTRADGSDSMLGLRPKGGADSTFNGSIPTAPGCNGETDAALPIRQCRQVPAFPN